LANLKRPLQPDQQLALAGEKNEQFLLSVNYSVDLVARVSYLYALWRDFAVIRRDAFEGIGDYLEDVITAGKPAS
jgi:hypothetical protein